MKTYISLLLSILVLFVTQPNTGQCDSNDTKLLQNIHCTMLRVNIQLEENQDDVRCQRSGQGKWTCYKFVTKQLTWDPARRFCYSYAAGADLVAIESADERDFLSLALQELHRGCQYFHTSGRKWYNVWRWMATGQDMVFTSWAANEPSGNGNYLHLWNRGVAPGWSTWDDSKDLNECFVCEHHIQLPSYCQ